MRPRQLLAQEAFWSLFLASFVALFFEALLIRWLPTSIYYLGYFKNCILIATFLGFGIGCATRLRADRLLPVFTLLCSTFVLGILVAEDHLKITPFQTGEFLWEHPGGGTVTVSMHLFLVAAFVAAALLMIPLGRLVGIHLVRYRPLVAYAINLVASVLGVAAFLLLSFLRLGPQVWFAAGLLPLLYFFRRRPRAAAASLAGTLLIIGMVHVFSAPGAIWSPYYKITMQDAPHPDINARMLLTNNKGHQVLYDLSADRLAHRPPGPDRVWKLVDDHVTLYESAYAVRPPDSVLIIGGGTGNEAAAALRRGAQSVDVVEIDPVIIELGTRLHPERPYDDPRVRVINDDARHYMATTEQCYDLIIFGFLDSTSYLSSLSNIRLDNYVYTLEGFRSAAGLLNPGGLMQVTYYAVAPFVRSRIFHMLDEVFGHRPLMFRIPGGFDDYVYFAGPAVAAKQTVEIPGMVQVTVPDAAHPGELPVDDWPFMNVPTSSIGEDYLVALLVMAVISAAAIYGFIGIRRSGRLHPGRLTVMFLLGMAFMLLETLTVTRVALVLGSTWIVTQVAVIIVLLASLAATQIVLRFPFPTRTQGFGLVLAGALLNFVVPMQAYETLGPLRLAAVAVALYLPVLGSSIIFCRVFAETTRSDAELGFNILGAVFGGLFEYASLVTGIGSMYLGVIVIFLLAGVILRLGRWRAGRSTARLDARPVGA